MSRRGILAFLIFLTGFGVYLFSSAPALGPYRDMGEMVSVSETLGVAHPPGYPAYTLLGKISTFFPLANHSYKVCLLSSAGGALSALLLFLLLLRLGALEGAAFAASLLWICASGVWTVALVTEMYALNLASAFLIIYCWACEVKETPEGLPQLNLPWIYLAAFLTGALAGIRLDLVLLAPAMAAAVVYSLYRQNRLKDLVPIGATASGFAALGFTIYAYLWIRSRQGPYLNWRSPDTFAKVWETIARKSHGGTLDLLSVNYKPGELFTTDFLLYLKDLGAQFWWVGFPLAVGGLVYLYRRNKTFFVLTLTGWIFAAPYFLYKANLPPNPHAYAILEAHFLLPNILVAVWMGLGIHWLVSSLGSGLSLWGGIACCLLAAFSLFARWPDLSKRQNFTGCDYARNIFRTLPPDSVLVMQKDVQLFLFWALQYAEKIRPDVVVVARGLSSSPWYEAQRKASGVQAFIGPLKTEQDWAEFMGRNAPSQVFAGWEQDVPFSPLYDQVPAGLVRRIAPKTAAVKISTAGADPFRDFYVYRGDYRYEKQKDFFSSDLVDDYSKAHFGRGVERSRDLKNPGTDEPDWNRCTVLNSSNPLPYYRRAFIYFQRGDLAGALRDFIWSERLYEKMVRDTQEYHSLPDLVQGIRNEWAECNLNIGVAQEKLGDREKSEWAYLKVLEINPRFAKAHYNIAVLYWNRDWRKVVDHLEQALRIDPSNPEANAYLPRAREALRKTGGA